MKTFKFITYRQISILDVLTMGDSEKAEDATKIGQYASGLKYAIALLLRNGIRVSIRTANTEKKVAHEFSFFRHKLFDQKSDKTKDVIGICDMDLNTGCPTKHITSFSTKLGLEWELGYAFRELASNAIDEGGYWVETDINPPNVFNTQGTIITLTWEDNPEWDDIIANTDLWVLTEKTCIAEIGKKIEIHSNTESHLKLYKQGILIYEDKDKPSMYTYNTPYGDINEMRVLKDVYTHMNSIFKAIMGLTEPELLKYFVFSEDCIEKDDALNMLNGFEGCNDALLLYASSIYDEHKNYYTFDPIRKAINERKDSYLPGRAISKLGDHIWSHYGTVTVEEVPQVITITKADELTMQQRIEKLYNMEVNCDIQLAVLSTTTIVADKYNNRLLITDEFDPELHFVEFLLQYFDLTQKGNLLTNMAKYIQTLIRK